MESYLQQRILLGIEELEVVLLRSDDKICTVTLAELALDKGGYHRFVVNEKVWGKEVADAARSAEQARNERER